MKKILISSILIAAVLASCSGSSSSGSTSLSSSNPLEPFADVAKMYSGISVGKMNTGRASEEEKDQATKANEARKKLVESGVGIEVTTEPGDESIEIIEPVKVVKVEPGNFCLYIDIECKIKMVESVPVESNGSSANRGLKLVGYAGETPCLVEYEPNSHPFALDNRDEVDGNPQYEMPEGAIYTMHQRHVIRPCWADRFAKLEKFVVTFTDDPDVAEAGLYDKMKAEFLDYNQTYK